MIKYCFKVFDPDGSLIIQTVAPADQMFEILSYLREFGVVKAFILEDDVQIQDT